MKRSKNLDRAIIVVVLLLFFGVVYYVGIETGKRLTISKKETKEEVSQEVFPPSVTSVELKVYGELLEEEPPPVTAPSPLTTVSLPETTTAPVSLKTEEKEISRPKKEFSKRTIYTVQVASYKKREEAQKMVTMLRKKGYPVYMVPAMVGGVVHYRVRIGEFKSASEAEKMKEKIERVEKMKAFITLKER